MNFALIGCGGMGHYHAREMKKIQGVNILWAVDVLKERAERFSREFAIPHFSTDYRDAFSDPRVEAVSIVTNCETHAPLAVSAAEAGKHILVEKPMAASLREAEEMVEAAEKAKVKLCVCQNYRYNPLILEIKKILRNFPLGEPIYANIDCHLWMNPGPDYRTFREMGVHMVDLARFILQREPERVSAHICRLHPQARGDIATQALYLFQGGVPVSLTVSFASKGEPTPVHGLHRYEYENGAIQLSSTLKVTLWKPQRVTLLPKIDIRDQSFFGFIAPLVRFVIEDFLESIRSGRAPRTSGQDNLKTLKALFAAYEAAERTEAIPIDPEFNRAPGG